MKMNDAMRKSTDWARRTNVRGVRSTGCHALSRLYSFAVTVLTVLCAASCRSPKMMTTNRQQSTSYRADSAVTETKRTQALSVPASATVLHVPLDSFLKLPQGAEYSSKSGRSGVKLKRLHGSDGRDTIRVDAGCDSLEMLVSEYERKFESYSNQRDNRTDSTAVTKPQKSSVKTVFKWYSGGVLTGAAVIILIRILRRRLKGQL